MSIRQNQVYSREQRSSSPYEACLQRNHACDLYSFNFGDSIVRAHAQAIVIGEKISLPIDIKFDPYSKMGEVVIRNHSIEDPLGRKYIDSFHIGCLVVEPEGKIDIEYCAPPSANLQILLNQRLEQERHLIEAILEKYNEEYLLSSILSAADPISEPPCNYCEYLQQKLPEDTSTVAIDIFSAGRTRRIAELLSGHIQVALAHFELIQGQNDTTSLDWINAVRSASKDLGGSCRLLLDSLTTQPPLEKEHPIDTVKRGIIDDYASSHPILLLASRIATRCNHIQWASSEELDPASLTPNHITGLIEGCLLPAQEYTRSLSGFSNIHGVNVATHQLSLLAPQQYGRFSDLCVRLTMDTSRPIGDRDGFTVSLDENHIRSMLAPESTVIFSVTQGRDVVGFVVLYTSLDALSKSDRDAAERFIDSKAISADNTAYLYLVGTNPSYRKLFRSEGKGIYRTLLEESIVNFCRLHGISTILLDVWEDNSAKEFHSAVGFKPTGIVRLMERPDGTFQRLQYVYDVPHAEVGLGHPNSSSVEAAHRLRALQVMGSPKDILRRRSFEATTTEEALALVESILAERLPGRVSESVAIAAESGREDGETRIELIFDDRRFYLVQALRNQDLWYAMVGAETRESLRDATSRLLLEDPFNLYK